jgi:hypothetical protein
MWNPFSKKPLLSDEDFFFQIDTYKWLLRNFGGDDFYKGTTLVLPTKEHFPVQTASQDQLADAIFLQVKKYACMDEWPCELQAQEPDVERRVAPTIMLQGEERSPLGTFSVDESKKIVITYNPAIVSNTTQLVATFAHELAHYLTGTCKEPPPGGWENWEFATDLAAVFMGFGIFMANSAFNFSQYSEFDSQGWSTSNSGYLSQAEFSFALAIFVKLKDIQPDSVYPYLNSNVKSLFKKSLMELNESSSYLELTMVEYAPVSA